MSGPITVVFGIDFGVLILAEHALREAQAMKREYGEVLAQLKRRESELARTREGQQAARLERIAATRRDAARQVARIERLRALAGGVPGLALRLPQTTLTPPQESNDAAWGEY